jgi:hypothetical protein
MPLNEEGFITRVSLRHSVSPDAVRRGAVRVSYFPFGGPLPGGRAAISTINSI